MKLYGAMASRAHRVVWMLRELGKQDLGALREFLAANVGRMPRTMLRYAIERMSERERKEWLKR